MNNPLYTELSPVEKSEFLGKLIVAAQSDYFNECCDIVNRAQNKGLFEKIKFNVNESHPEIMDVDNPIENGIN